MPSNGELTLPQQRTLRILRRSYGWMSARTLQEKDRTLMILVESGLAERRQEAWNMPGRAPEWEYRIVGGTT